MIDAAHYKFTLLLLYTHTHIKHRETHTNTQTHIHKNTMSRGQKQTADVLLLTFERFRGAVPLDPRPSSPHFSLRCVGEGGRFVLAILIKYSHSVKFNTHNVDGICATIVFYILNTPTITPTIFYCFFIYFFSSLMFHSTEFLL